MAWGVSLGMAHLPGKIRVVGQVVEFGIVAGDSAAGLALEEEQLLVGFGLYLLVVGQVRQAYLKNF